MFKKAVIGGTFNTLHMGHKKILENTFTVGRSVIIGLTSDEFAQRFRVRDTLPYATRKKNLQEYINKVKENKPYEIIKIDDSYGIATLDPEIDCIVVSEETLLRAEEINAIRFKKGLDKITIVVVPIILAEDGKPISGNRISAGEINEEGKKLI